MIQVGIAQLGQSLHSRTNQVGSCKKMDFSNEGSGSFQRRKKNWALLIPEKSRRAVRPCLLLSGYFPSEAILAVVTQDSFLCAGP